MLQQAYLRRGSSQCVCVHNLLQGKENEVLAGMQMERDHWKKLFEEVRDSSLACVAVCCSVLQCIAICCSVLQRKWREITGKMCLRRSVALICVAVCCSAMQCGAVCGGVLQCVAECVAV